MITEIVECENGEEKYYEVKSGDIIFGVIEDHVPGTWIFAPCEFDGIMDSEILDKISDKLKQLNKEVLCQTE